MALFALWILCGVGSATTVIKSARYHGWETPWILANFAGVVGACFGSVVTWYLLTRFVRHYLHFPICATGRCSKFDDYGWNPMFPFGLEKRGTYAYFCKCELNYVRIDGVFRELHSNGSYGPPLSVRRGSSETRDRTN